MTRTPLPRTVPAWTKAVIGTVAAGAMLSATPVLARDRHDDGIGAGEIIAGAVVLGGLAAILASGNDRYDRYDSRYRGRYDDPRHGYGYDYRRYGDSRSAVNQCVNAVQRRASRYGRADVTEVTRIDRKRDGYKIKGRLVVRDGYGRWGRGGSYDKGKFSCDVRYGRVHDLDVSGLRR